jgi:hypothetical protein
MKNKLYLIFVLFTAALFIIGCSDDDNMTEPTVEPKDPNTAEVVSVDRFSAGAGVLFVRNGSNGLPAANQPINFDQGPFITQGLGPDGQVVKYYNFDVLSATPAPIFVLFKEGSDTPVDGQLNIIDVIPGDVGYNDFWHVHKVTVPNSYVANTVASAAEVNSFGYNIEATNILVNCPVVPEGSTANLKFGGGASVLVKGWYKDKVVFYFSFEEKALTTSPSNPVVPLSPIYVTFNINPDQPGGGPGSGFVTEPGSVQTHNVVETIPSDSDYSPLWSVNVYNNTDFANVSNLATAMSANILAQGVALVNCPIVSVQ